MERRRSRRFARRMTVRFGDDQLDRSGLTCDISSTGAFIVSSHLPPLDTRLHLQVLLDSRRSIFLEGVVRRHRVVPPSLRQIERGGFGVRFLTPAELISEIVPQLAAGNRFEIAFEDKARFVQAYEQQFRHGGIFLITEKKLPRDVAVLLEVKLAYERLSWTFAGRVVQVMEAGTRGLAVVFDDRREVESALRPHLA
ncbi:MAG: PilZ domain-containing protein [Myxococcales bacterium]|jgi:Tfp pilus assembly protein PilZ